MKEYVKLLNNGANQSTIKHSNRGLVFDVLNTLGKCSRTQMAKITGLTKTSITNITTEMIDEGIISEGELTGTGVGRKQVMLEISSESPCALGVSINRDAVFVSLVNLKGEIRFEKRLPLASKEASKSFLKKVFDGCDAALAANGKKPVLGIGVASIGPLDLKAGMILSPPNFRGIKNVAIVSALRGQYGMNVYLDNDMNAGATVEKLFGYGKKLSNFVYVGVSRGIGAGVVLDKKLYTGSNGLAGEIGHIIINYKGRQCPCGNKGCMEMYASVSAIEHEARHKLAQGAKSELAGCAEVSWDDIVRAARSGDPLAEELIASLTGYLTAGLVSVCNMHDPQVIFLGHEIAEAGDLVIPALKENINRQVFSKDFAEVDIKVSCYGAESHKVSGAAVLINKFVNGEMVEKQMGDEVV